jgi:SAM-dependent methyltransferase
MRRREVTKRVVPPPLPADPFSDAFRAWVFDLYRAVAGRDDYAVELESASFDLEAAILRPHPFATGSPAVVGDDLSARGSVGRALALTPPGRIVEFGGGWGKLTSDLAAMGHDVTVVEIDAGFCRLIEGRVPCARVVEAGMLSFIRGSHGDPFDAAVFCESVHHCAGHLDLLEHLHAVVGTGGVVLGAEPVDLLAYPWGLRLDGLRCGRPCVSAGWSSASTSVTSRARCREPAGRSKRWTRAAPWRRRTW